MMARKVKPVQDVFFDGILKENPVLVLLLGTCPILAVTTSAYNGIGMGVATMFVLLCSNIVISLIRNFISDTVRIPVYITVIASFVTVVQMLIQAYVPALNESLGIFIPLITVNCIILGRAEAFASKNSPLRSIVDALGMGLGFTLACFLMGAIREIFGAGAIFGFDLPWFSENPILIFILPAGGFFVYGMLIALSTWFMRYREVRNARKERAVIDRYLAVGCDDPALATESACEGCTKADGCGMDEFRAQMRGVEPRPVPRSIKQEEGDTDAQ